MKKIVHFTKAQLFTWPGSFITEFIDNRKAYYKAFSWRKSPYESKGATDDDAFKFD